MVRFKARWVVCGCSQIPGVDYDETYSPVSALTTFRILANLAAHHDWVLHSADVKNAYLNGLMDREVYVELPQGYRSMNRGWRRRVGKLLKAVYGLKQAGLTWYTAVKKFLLSSGFLQSKCDPCLFIYRRDGNANYYSGVCG